MRVAFHYNQPTGYWNIFMYYFGSNPLLEIPLILWYEATVGKKSFVKILFTNDTQNI